MTQHNCRNTERNGWSSSSNTASETELAVSLTKLELENGSCRVQPRMGKPRCCRTKYTETRILRITYRHTNKQNDTSDYTSHKTDPGLLITFHQLPMLASGWVNLVWCGWVPDRKQGINKINASHNYDVIKAIALNIFDHYSYMYRDWREQESLL